MSEGKKDELLKIPENTWKDTVDDLLKEENFDSFEKKLKNEKNVNLIIRKFFQAFFSEIKAYILIKSNSMPDIRSVYENCYYDSNKQIYYIKLKLLEEIIFQNETMLEDVQYQYSLRVTKYIDYYFRYGFQVTKLHRLGLNHCDLKPRNSLMFIDENRFEYRNRLPYIIDFDLSVKNSEICPGGTPEYQALETAYPNLFEVQKEHFDKADVYSFGRMMQGSVFVINKNMNSLLYKLKIMYEEFEKIPKEDLIGEKESIKKTFEEEGKGVDEKWQKKVEKNRHFRNKRLAWKRELIKVVNSCTKVDPESRPSIEEVTIKLGILNVVDKLKKWKYSETALRLLNEIEIGNNEDEDDLFNQIEQKLNGLKDENKKDQKKKLIKNRSRSSLGGDILLI